MKERNTKKTIGKKMAIKQLRLIQDTEKIRKEILKALGPAAHLMFSMEALEAEFEESLCDCERITGICYRCTTDFTKGRRED